MNSFTLQTAKQGTRLRQTLNEVKQTLIGGNTDYQLSSISSYFPYDGYANCFKFRGNETENFFKFINEREYIKVGSSYRISHFDESKDRMKVTRVKEDYYLTPEVHAYISELRASFHAFYVDLQDYIPSWIDQNELYKLKFRKVDNFATHLIKYHTEMPTKFHVRINRLKFDVIIPELQRLAEYQGLNIVHYSHYLSEMDIYFKLK